VAWLRSAEWIDTLYGSKPNGFIYQVRNAFMEPCENIFIDKTDKLANDWRIMPTSALLKYKMRRVRHDAQTDKRSVRKLMFSLEQIIGLTGYCVDIDHNEGMTAYVFGGENQAVAKALYDNRHIGLKTLGKINVSYSHKLGSMEFLMPISFERPTVDVS